MSGQFGLEIIIALWRGATTTLRCGSGSERTKSTTSSLANSDRIGIEQRSGPLRYGKNEAPISDW
jgi:hypothetical protein